MASEVEFKLTTERVRPEQAVAEKNPEPILIAAMRAEEQLVVVREAALGNDEVPAAPVPAELEGEPVKTPIPVPLAFKSAPHVTPKEAPLAVTDTAPEVEAPLAPAVAIHPAPLSLVTATEDTMVMAEAPAMIDAKPAAHAVEISIPPEVVTTTLEPLRETAETTASIRHEFSLRDASGETPVDESLTHIAEVIELPIAECPVEIAHSDGIVPETETQTVLTTLEMPLVAKLEILLETAPETDILLAARLEALVPEQAEAVEDLLNELAAAVQTFPAAASAEERQTATAELEAIIIELLEELDIEADGQILERIVARCLTSETAAEEENAFVNIEVLNRLGTREYKPTVRLSLRPQTLPQHQLGSYTLRASATRGNS